MKILDIEQRSEEWYAFREGKISGSKAAKYSKPRYVLKAELVDFARSKGYDFPPTLTIEKIRDMMTQAELNELDSLVQINDSIYKLIAEKVAKPINHNDYADRLGDRSFSMMARGEVLEEEALEKIAEKLGKNVTPGRVWQADFNDEVICSPDGEIVTNGKVTEAVEIKCPDSWKVVKAFYENEPPKEYEQQIVQYFLVNEELETLYFAIYSDVFAAVPKLELQIFEIKRNGLQAEIEMAGLIEENVLKIVNDEVAKLMF